ncbi:MAG: molybdopterin-dependent oxidoreductase [Thaumarchaeota archaeon]|nr:molybdopterin-dependent oxidoreductase [Nitrososphaerota archaeon]
MSARRVVPLPNLETSLRDLTSPLTPNHSFFVRTHFDAPVVDLGKWRLAIRGEASRPTYFSYEELTSMRQKTITSTLECAGNGRTGFPAVAEGEVPWGVGAVGTGRWSGVVLKNLLSICQASKDATQVVVEGEDSGRVAGRSDPVHYIRALPMKEALKPGVVLALSMNSDPIPVEHGFPARLIVPGWYGMASVKWVRSISVLSGPPLETHFNTRKYVYVSDGSSNPVRGIRVKTLVTSPEAGAHLRVGQRVVLRGKAWSGEGRIVRVEVEVEGKSMNARVTHRMGRYAWADWTLDWRPRDIGEVKISARAIDRSGNVQPVEPFENRYQYGFNAVRPVRVHVLE